MKLKKQKNNFWDFCAPFYDFFSPLNAKVIQIICGAIPKNANVLEAAAGTGRISAAIAHKAKTVLCTDNSEKMLALARKKAAKRGVKNIQFENISIFNISKPDNSFDAVIASKVLHLIDEPEKAAAELRRVSKNVVIIPQNLIGNVKGSKKLMVCFYKFLGYKPKRELLPGEYADFLCSIGFEHCEILHIDGAIPFSVAIWRKNNERE
jgi:ubiquinone/menaquinone biosynthesis C-methylase UbiE